MELIDEFIDWGIPFTEAKHAREWRCPHNDCNWGFDLYRQKSAWSKHVIGFNICNRSVTICCPTCQGWLWVHVTNMSNRILKQVKDGCPNWPK